jgi:hypothetical protein
MKNRSAINFVIFFFIIAIATLSYSGISDFLLKQRGVRTDGIVVYESVRSQGKMFFYKSTNPVVKYIDNNGKDYSILDCESCHKIGDRVPIIYDPRDPEKAMIDTRSSDFSLVYYLVGFIGFLIFFIILKKRLISNKYSDFISRS